MKRRFKSGDLVRDKNRFYRYIITRYKHKYRLIMGIQEVETFKVIHAALDCDTLYTDIFRKLI